MIRLSARQDERPGSEGAFVFVIEAPEAEPFVTDNSRHAVEHLAALGVENPDALVDKVQQWREIEIR